MSARTVILSAPSGWDNFLNIEVLPKLYGCTRLIENFDWRRDAVIPGALHLTNVRVADMRLLELLRPALRGNVDLIEAILGWRGGAA